MAVKAGKTVVVDVVSDILCPWCWIGKRNLEEAIKRLPTEQRHKVEVRWHPFQLRPQVSKQGAPKPPSTQNNPRVGPRLRSAGNAVGIDFTGKTDRTPNTLESHTLLHFAAETAGYDVQNRLQEVLFRQYFTDGVFPDTDGLTAAAKEVGLDVAAAWEYVQDSENQRRIALMAQRNSEAGISGVPFFIVNSKPMFSGAQPPEAFLAAFEEAGVGHEGSRESAMVTS